MLSIRKLFGLPPKRPPASGSADANRTLSREWVDRGIAAEASGSHTEALQCYRAAIAADPDHPAAHYNLALAFLASDAPAQAETVFRTALGLRSAFPEAWVGLAEALEVQGRDSEALTALTTAIDQRHHYVGALLNSSLLLRRMGQFAQAEASLLQIDPMALFSAGRHAEAESISRQLTEAWPDYGIGWQVLGAVLAVRRRFAEAAPALRRALALLPQDAETHHNLAIVLQALGQSPAAEASYRRAIQLKPDYFQAHNDLGNLLQSLDRYAEAEASSLRALEIEPEFFEAHSALGNIFTANGRLSDALRSYRSALKINPEHHPAHNNLGVALAALGKLPEAESSFRRALEIKPDYREGHDNLLFLLNYAPDKSPLEVFSAYQDFDTLFGRPLRADWRPHGNDRRPDRRLKVGYVSPDFRKHAARHFVEPLLERHDRSLVEVFAYAEVPREDAITARMKSNVDHWISTCAMDDAQVADRIRADGIDILVDLAGHTLRNRLPVFARKPAPVSVTTIGFGYTTGLSAIDWFMTDGVVAPEGTENVFSEKLWRIPLCQVYRPADDMGPAGSLPALRRGHVTFGTLTRAVRLNPRVVDTWSNVLRRVPGSRLSIDSLNFREPDLCADLVARFAAHGIPAERLDTGFHSPPWDVVRGFDISLDCFPQNSGTTLFDSVYMGIPFVTLADRPSLGRLGASIATHIGHPEWIAASQEEYVDIAVMLATDLQKLSAMRDGMREAMRASLLMDETGYVREVENAYREMWQQWCAS